MIDLYYWPWVLPAKRFGQGLDEFPNVRRWHEAMKARPAARRGVDLGAELRCQGPPGEEERRILFGQTAETVRGGQR